MGCGSSTENDKRSQDINVELRKERKRMAREVKLLLLGAGESGKSTIAKQMKIIYLSGFTEEELLTYKPVLQSNALEAIKLLVIACRDFEYELEEEHKKMAEPFYNINTIETSLTNELRDLIKDLWKDPAVKKAHKRRAEFQLHDSSEYIISNIDRISDPDFVPIADDVLRCRARTTGIHETEFTVGKLDFRMVDVGGQRSERKKWVHCFQDVTAIIFVVAMNEYDMKLYEDENVNRMHEAIQLFDEICNSKWFQNTSMILFLNKKDLFEEKIKTTELTACFPEYKGENTYESSSKYLEQKFKELNRQEDKQVYTHFTCATDTENIKFVFNAAKDIILNNNLTSAGF